VTNNDSSPHEVKLRYFHDYQVADTDSLSNVTFEAQDLAGQNTGDVLPGDNIGFDRSGFSVGSGDSESVDVAVGIPDDLSPDCYEGRVETRSGEGNVSLSVSISHAVVVDEPPLDDHDRV